MMPLLFRRGADLIDESQRSLEVRKYKFLLNVMIVHYIPVIHLRAKRLDLRRAA